MNIENHLKKSIQIRGFISIDQMMREVLTANVNSYYKQLNILGENGDFITSPEISQLFGEIIGLWVIEQWQKLGSPLQINLVELGPGRGLLMRDLLRTAKLIPAFYQSLSIQLLEINPHLIIAQKANLSLLDRSIGWINNIEEIKQIPTILIANEFFDALPIKQYVKDKGLWQEIVLNTNDDKLEFAKMPINAKLHNRLQSDYTEANNGAIVEESAESSEIINSIAKHFKKFLGSALIIDYGYDHMPNIRNKYQYNSTLQAVKNHQYHPVLEALGTADLSAHVDFYALNEKAKKQDVNVEKIITQNQFLAKYGIELRLKLLSENLDSPGQAILKKQVDRLLDKKQMGELFKVMQFSSK